MDIMFHIGTRPFHNWQDFQDIHDYFSFTRMELTVPCPIKSNTNNHIRCHSNTFNARNISGDLNGIRTQDIFATRRVHGAIGKSIRPFRGMVHPGLTVTVVSSNSARCNWPKCLNGLNGRCKLNNKFVNRMFFRTKYRKILWKH